MKKLFFALTCIAALVWTGCSSNNPSKSGTDVSSYTEAEVNQLDNKKERCWCVMTVVTMYGQTEKSEAYMWGTEREVAQNCLMAIEIAKKEYQKLGVNATVKMYYQEATDAKTEEACDKLASGKNPNPGGPGVGGEKACYYVVGFTRDQYGHLVIEMNAYMWVTEDELADLMAELKNGWGVTETQAFPVNANDEYSCEHDKINPNGWDEFWEKYSGY